MSNWPTIEEANNILDEWCMNKNLKKHAYAVASAMKTYAGKYNGDPVKWEIVVLLHDFDYEKYPDLKDHPFKGAAYLEEKGYDRELIEGVLAHARHSGANRDTELKKAIFAVDELTGLIVAVALTRPSRKIADVTVESVLKKWKEKAFAAGVNRAEIEQGAGELGVPLNKHIETVLQAMQDISDKLGL
jgi:predicted hydrolase (HD superfamily)